MTVVSIKEKPRLRNPVLIEGLPGIGNVGKVCATYLISELKAKKFATMYSEWFFPFVMIKGGSNVHLLKNELYYYKSTRKGGRDLIILTGDSQSISPNGHYEIAEKVIDLCEKMGVKEIITIGGLSVESISKKPKVIGVVTHPELVKKYSKYNIDFNAESKVGYIVGATGLLLGVGAERGMKGLGLLGETIGFPIITDPKSAEEVLKILIKILNIKINLKKIEERAREMEDFIKRIESIQKKALMDMVRSLSMKEKPREEVGYIG